MLAFSSLLLSSGRSCIETIPGRKRNLYLFNERANLSAFAGAIWRCGGYTVEEYSARKGEGKSAGRIDLYFIYDDKEIICEAKNGWLLLSDQKSKPYKDNIRDFHADANNDLTRSLDANPEFHGLSLTFVTLYWDKDLIKLRNGKDRAESEVIDDLKKQLKWLKDELKQEGQDIFYAYIDVSSEPIVGFPGTPERRFRPLILVGQYRKGPQPDCLG